MDEKGAATALSDQAAGDEREWRNPANWKLGAFYYSARDSRDWVARRSLIGRRPYGVAPNLAKPRARRAAGVALALLLAAILAAAILRTVG